MESLLSGVMADETINIDHNLCANSDVKAQNQERVALCWQDFKAHSLHLLAIAVFLVYIAGVPVCHGKSGSLFFPPPMGVLRFHLRLSRLAASYRLSISLAHTYSSQVTE